MIETVYSVLATMLKQAILNEVKEGGGKYAIYLIRCFGM